MVRGRSLLSCFSNVKTLDRDVDTSEFLINVEYSLYDNCFCVVCPVSLPNYKEGGEQ